MSARPLVLVVSAGDEADRGYCLEQVAAAYDIVLLTGAEPSWEKPHIVDHAVADLNDTTALLSAGRALAERHDLDGVVTWDEWNLVPTARLARVLGLAANSVEVMRACRNKAAAAAGSIGVVRIDRPEELPAAFEFASAGASRSREESGVLVEEYLDGPEVSVECVTHRGTTTAVAVTRKRLGPAPYFDETGHTVDAADPLLATVAPTAAAASRPWESPTAYTTSRCAWSAADPG